MADQAAAVTREDALAFADEAFRNRDITFSHRDVVDMTGALSSFLSRRCLASVSSASAEGFVLVPRKLTDDMHEAVVKLDFTSTHDPLWPEYWAAMLDAAPNSEPVPATNQAGEVEATRLYERWADNEFASVRDLILAALATQPATSQEGSGTFACPICGDDKPHYHASKKIMEPVQCPECGVGRPGHESGCSRATVLTLGVREPLSATQPATSQEDARGDFGVGQDELVAGFKRALQHPAGDHDGWTDAGMEDAFFRWPVIVNALNKALASNRTATSQEGEAVDRVAKAIYEAGGSLADQNGFIAWADLDGSNDAENFRKMALAALAAAPTPPTLSEDLRACLARLEQANDAVATATTRERYLADLADVQPALLELDDARCAARAALNQEGSVTAGMVAYARAEIGNLVRQKSDMRLDGLCDEEIEGILRAALAQVKAS